MRRKPEATEKALDFASTIHGAVIFPRGNPVWVWRNHQREAKLQSQLA